MVEWNEVAYKGCVVFNALLISGFIMGLVWKDINKWRYADEDFWRERLTDEEYEICRLKGTELPYSGEYMYHDEDGVYNCKCCGEPLFTSEHKYIDEDHGWPSFSDYIEGSLRFTDDYSFGLDRVEVLCSQCDCHQGHVFEDGPAPDFLRYCINSVCLDFEAE